MTQQVPESEVCEGNTSYDVDMGPDMEMTQQVPESEACEGNTEESYDVDLEMTRKAPEIETCEGNIARFGKKRSVRDRLDLDAQPEPGSAASFEDNSSDFDEFEENEELEESRFP